MVKIKMMSVLLVVCVAAPAMAQPIQITTTGECWIREVAPDTVYDPDGLNIYNSLSSTDQARRVTLIEFDLTGVDLASKTGVELDLYSIAGWSSEDYPTVSEAFIIDTAGVSIAGETWNGYMGAYDAGKVALASLGAYNYDTITNEPSAYDTYVKSTGSAGDLALVQAETDGLLTLAIFAVEIGYEVRADWEDDTYYGNRGILTLVPEPMTMSLLGLGGLALLRRKRK